MSAFFVLLRQSPTWARAVPYVAVVILTSCQGLVSGAGPFWMYFAKLVVGGWLLWLARAALPELRWNLSWEAIVAGVGVFVLWVGLDPLLVKLGLPNSYPKLNLGQPWNPPATFGQHTWAAILFITVRLAGSTVLVPMLEEVFFRSLMYRYIVKDDFLRVPMTLFSWRAFLLTSAIFGVAHSHWLAGLLCGFAYQGLVCRKGRLGDAVTAHGITNLLLGLWVVWKGAWQFW